VPARPAYSLAIAAGLVLFIWLIVTAGNATRRRAGPA
jgi:hypothetical protein